MKNITKRIISVFLTVFMMVGLFVFTVQFSVPAVAAETVLVPQYGSNGKFLAPIEAPVAGSIPISSRAELEKIGKDPSYPLSGTYHLTQDISLSGAEWVPIGDSTEWFTGTFDGQGHVIRNMKITGSDYTYAGLIGYANNATIKNTGVENTFIDVSNFGYFSYAGGICGTNSSGSISNCYNTGNVSASSTSTKTFSGPSNSDDYYYNSSYSYTGGICGFNVVGGSISNCYNAGNVSASSTSTSAPPLDFSYYYSGSYSYAGGICGDNSTEGSINNCYNAGNVSAFSTSPLDFSTYSGANSKAGGISGINSTRGSISNCYNTGNVSASSTSTSTYSGSSSSSSSSSGICENSSDGSISNCYNTGNVSASSTSSGSSGSSGSSASGICGGSGFGSISNCYNTGDVSASSSSSSNSDAYSNAVGIGGSSFGSISNCYNTGDVSASSSSSSNSYSYSDGICGSNDLGSISNCYNTGDVSASSSSSSNSDAYSNAGGICRSNVVGGSISNCYNTGDVSASSSSSDSYNSSYAGGICGDNSTEGSINNCYWNSDSAQTVNGLPQSPKNGVGRGTDTTTPLTTSQMKVQSSFVGFDFSSVWGISTSINNGYPYLWYPVVSVTPSGGSVAISGNVVITFSEAMNTTSGTISLNSTTLTGGIWSSGNTVFTIPYSGLSYNTTYAVNISGFKNVSGNTMTADSSHGFTTVATPTTTTSQFTNNNTFNGSGSRTNFLMPVAIVGGIVLFGLIGVLAFIITRRNSG